ncbi:MAG: acyl-CoA dehydrogenase family protein, partial [Pseudomonadota bacterium]
MPSYTPPLRDMKFVLHEVLKVQDQKITGYEDLTEDFTGAVLEEAGKIASEVLAPLNFSGDREGCVLENGVVRTPKGFKEAFDQLREGGWTGLDCAEEFGGQGLPYVMGTAVGEMLVSGNLAFMMYPGLTHGAYSAINLHGSQAQKETYLPKMVTCEWTGTMNLTEPHCGTDLG